MKRFYVILLALFLIIFAACGKPEPAFNAEEQLSLAEQLFDSGKYEETIIALENILEVEPRQR